MESIVADNFLNSALFALIVAVAVAIAAETLGPQVAVDKGGASPAAFALAASAGAPLASASGAALAANAVATPAIQRRRSKS
jgi:hypothetical protein